MSMNDDLWEERRITVSNTEQTPDGKYSFKFRLDVQNKDNEFMTDNLVFLDIKDTTPENIVKLLNLSLNAQTKTRVKKSKFEVFKEES